MKSKITCSGRYLKLERFYQENNLLEEKLYNVEWRRHVQRINSCQRKQNTLVEKNREGRINGSRNVVCSGKLLWIRGILEWENTQEENKILWKANIFPKRKIKPINTLVLVSNTFSKGKNTLHEKWFNEEKYFKGEKIRGVSNIFTQRKYSSRGYISGESIAKRTFVRRESNRKGKII